MFFRYFQQLKIICEGSPHSFPARGYVFPMQKWLSKCWLWLYAFGFSFQMCSFHNIASESGIPRLTLLSIFVSLIFYEYVYIRFLGFMHYVQILPISSIEMSYTFICIFKEKINSIASFGNFALFLSCFTDHSHVTWVPHVFVWLPCSDFFSKNFYFLFYKWN